LASFEKKLGKEFLPQADEFTHFSKLLVNLSQGEEVLSQADEFNHFLNLLVALRQKVAGHYGSSAPSIAVHSKAAPSKAVLHEIPLLRTAPSSVNKSKRPEAVLRKAAPTPTPAALPSTPLQTAPSSVNKSKRRCDQGVVSTAVRLFVMSAVFSSCCYYSNSNLESDVPSGSVILRLLLSLFIAATVTTFVDDNIKACRDEIGKILGM